MDSNETRHWFKLPVPLAWLCGLDEQPAANALPDAFGDRYLYANNPIFRRVRDAALNFGYRFSSEDTPLWRDYQAFPLTTLHRIMAEKTIPYYENGATIKRLLRDNPKGALSPGFLISSLTPNHAFHESAHCVAYSVMRSFDSDLRVIASAEKHRFVLEAVLLESFANAVEWLGSIIERMRISDTVFYELNSYMPRNGKVKSALETAVSGMGAAMRFFVLFLASFEANLTAEPPTATTYQRLASAVECRAEHLSALEAVTDVGFGLRTGFRENTNPMYFALLGHGAEYVALAESSWVGQAVHQRFVRELSQALFETVLGESQPVGVGKMGTTATS